MSKYEQIGLVVRVTELITFATSSLTLTVNDKVNLLDHSLTEIRHSFAKNNFKKRPGSRGQRQLTK